MSADPARSGPHPVARPATVLTFPATGRQARGQGRTSAVPPDPLTPQQRLAASLEDLFARHGRSLTDDDTAEDYRITLGAVRNMLEGAHKTGKIDERQYGTLNAMIEGMLAAPDLLG